jgi:replicative DNA helicase
MLDTKIVNKFLTDKEFFRTFSSCCKANLFSDPNHKEAISLLNSFIREYNRYPTRKETFIDYAAGKGKETDFLNNLNDIYNEKTEEDQETFIKITIEFFETRRIQNAMMDILNKLEKGKSTNLINECQQMIRSCQVSQTQNEEAVNGDEVYEMWKNKPKTKVISTGYKTLDHMLNGGFHENTLSIIGAETNAGKTVMLQNFFVNMIKEGHNGLYITYELDRLQIFERILATITNIPIHELRDMNCKPHIDGISAKWAIEHLPDGSHTIEVDNLIERYRDKGMQFDFIVIDYLGCMSSEKKGSESNNLYEKYGYVVEYLKNLAQTHQIPIITAQQLNRSGYSKDDINMASLSDSMKIAHKADVVFFMSKEGDIEHMRVIKMTLNKSRVSGLNGMSQIMVMDKMRQTIDEDLGRHTTLLENIMNKKENGSKKGEQI